ncbi:MAG: hypothetical protein ABI230_09215 [Aestuariivirga sp.]
MVGAGHIFKSLAKKLPAMAMMMMPAAMNMVVMHHTVMPPVCIG